ncbi:MAG TPA: NAD(P)H-binding protein [Roseiflexaceae bacterium]|nr:NAD(P)H-binding protein [Roseiflexaceae bacterium]
MSNTLTLVLGGTGKTGRRVVERLQARGLPVRIGSRNGEPRFDWNDQSTWADALRGVAAAYIAYVPDLGAPGARETIGAFVDQAVRSGVRRLVLLSGRGEPEAQRCEQLVQESGAAWTVVRASWFAQNFSEDFLSDLVMGGVVALPTGDVREPFVDADDIADVAVAALTGEGHAGQIYELTGPRLLTFAEAVAAIAAASGREVQFVPITREEFVAGLEQYGLPADLIALLDNLFTTTLDGRNAYLADGVQRALGRAPRDFGEYARDAATAGAWQAVPA